MPNSPVEQRNPHLGNPVRPWLKLRFLDAYDATIEVALLADTGCPFALILGQDLLDKLERMPGNIRHSNTGFLYGAWVRLVMPEFGFDHDVLAYGNQDVASGVASDHPSFQGLVGLPLLRLGEYGGNANEFWFRR